MASWFAPILISCAAMWAAGAPLIAQTSLGGRRVIDAGPEHPTAAVFRRQFVDFEKLPFDGTVIQPTRQLADGVIERADLAFSRHPWQPGEMEAMVADLKAIKPTRARDNFLVVRARPGDVDWFDETGWRETVDHWRLLARAAKLGGLRGLAFELGSGEPLDALFNYSVQLKRQEKDFAAYAKVARDRGRDVMLAVASEFPEAIIFCPGLYSELLPLVSSEANPASLLRAHPLGLLPSFLDGWWDAAPPKVQIIDGQAVASRAPVDDVDFNRAYTRMRTQAVRLAAPEHRTKWRTQLVLGQGISLDGFLPSPGGSAGRGQDSVAADLRLTAAASLALRASDGWIWVHGKSGTWWSHSAGSPPPFWADVFPGVGTSLARARTPAAAALERLAAASPAENRLINGDFSKESPEGLPEGWWTWQRDDSRGRARREAPVPDANQPPTVSWTGASEAHFGQEMSVKSGEVYALGSRVKAAGPGTPVMKVGWKDARGQWAAEDANLILPADAAPDAEGWQELAAIVRVPSGATQLVIMLGALGQASTDDRIYFAQARAVPL